MIARKNEILEKIMENVKLFDVVCGTAHSKHVLPMLDEIKRGKTTPPVYLEPEMTHFGHLMFKIIFEKDKEKIKKTKKFLSEFNKKVYGLVNQ